MTNSADPDQLASSEANWSGSILFAKTGHVLFSKRRVNNASVVGTHSNCLSEWFLTTCTYHMFMENWRNYPRIVIRYSSLIAPLIYIYIFHTSLLIVLFLSLCSWIVSNNACILAFKVLGRRLWNIQRNGQHVSGKKDIFLTLKMPAKQQQTTL